MNTPRSIHLFVPCLVRDVMPDVARACLRVLGALGVAVHVPPAQTCCGQLLYKQGRTDELVPVALRLLDLFEKSPAVVAPSASCVAMVRAYPELFPEHSQAKWRAERLAAKTFELTEFLFRQPASSRLDLKLDAPMNAVYHASCQAERVLRIIEEPRALLSAIGGLTLAEAPLPSCCGFGGGFSMTYPEISQAILEEKALAFQETGADTVIGVEPSCLTHMDTFFRKHGIPLKVLHAAQALAMALPAKQEARP